MDVRARPNLWIGASAMRRWLASPFAQDGDILVEDTHETTVGGYVNTTLGDRWALSFEARNEHFRLDEAANSDLPDEVSTTALPLSLRWFGASGLFASIDATYVYQSIRQTADAPDASDDGLLLGGSVGYRLPNGRGVVTLAGGNLLDQELEIRDQVFNTARPQGPLYARDFTLFLTGTFVW